MTQSYIIVPLELRQTKLSELIETAKNKKILVYFAGVDLLDACHDTLTKKMTKKGLDSDMGDVGKRPLLEDVKFFK